MKYQIIGDSLPAVICTLEKGEQIRATIGSMAWMGDSIEMCTELNGISKFLTRAVTNEAVFSNRYVAKDKGDIAFVTKFPGAIRAVHLREGESIIAQKGSFLACTPKVSLTLYFEQKIANGIFGGEGFLLQRFTGPGVVFIEVDGSAHDYDLKEGEKLVVNTGNLAMMSDTCSMKLKSTQKVSNMLFGNVGLFNTAISGPGHVVVQTMPIMNTINMIANHIQVRINRKYI